MEISYQQFRLRQKSYELEDTEDKILLDHNVLV